MLGKTHMRVSIRLQFLLVLTAIWPSVPSEVHARLHSRFWTYPDGLSHCVSTSLNIGAQGGVWVGHDLSKTVEYLDGQSVRSIPSPGRYLPIYENEQGHIWALFWDQFIEQIGGVQQFKDGHWEEYPIEGITPGLVPIPLVPLPSERVLILLPKQLLLFDAVTGEASLLKSVRETNLQRFNSMASRDNVLWIVGEKGAARISLEEIESGSFSTWTEILLEPEFDFEHLRYPYIDTTGALYATAVRSGTSRDVFVSTEGNSWTIIDESEGDSRMFGVPDGQGGIWTLSGEYATLLTRLFLPPVRDSSFFLSPFTVTHKRVSAEEKPEHHYALSGILYDAAVDSDGSLFIAGSHAIARCSLPPWRKPADMMDFGKASIRIYEDPSGRIWFAFIDMLAVFEEGDWKTISLPFHVWGGNTYLCPLPDERIALRAGTPPGGLYSIDPETETCRRIPHPKGRKINFAAPRKNGGIWVISSDDEHNYLEMYDGNRYQELLKRSGIWSVRKLVEMQNEELWFIEFTAPVIARYKNGEYRKMGSDDGFPTEGCGFILDRGNGNLWFGINDRILEYNGEEFKTVRSGFQPMSSIMQTDDGDIWLTCVNGIHRFHEGSWVFHSSEDGLPDEAIRRILKDSRGRIWAGTNDGIYRYYPDVDTKPPETSIPTERNTAEIGPEGSTQFYFTGIDRWKSTRTERLLYSYRIDDKPWSPFYPEPVATLTGLRAGDHIFEVRAMDRNWNIDPTPASFQFRVLLPWYREPDFIVISILGCGIIAFLSWRLVSYQLNLRTLVNERTKSLTHTNRELRDQMNRREQLEKQILNISDTEKQRIGRDLHDSICQNMAGIAYLCEVLEEELEQDRIKQADQAKKLVSLINQSINHARRLAHGLCAMPPGEDSLEHALDELARRISGVYNVRCEKHYTQIPMLDDTAKTHIFRIAEEAAGNAVRHGNAQNINISVSCNDSMCVLSVKDDGKGFDVSGTNVNGMGIQIMEYRAHLMGGTLTVESDTDGGTHVTFSFPTTTGQLEVTNDHGETGSHR